VDVAKVDSDVAYIAMVVHVCCKLLFLMFRLFFRRCKYVYFGRCVCFMHVLQVFYLDVAYVFCNGFLVFLGVLASVSDACFKCFICFQTYVVSIASKYFKSRSDVTSHSLPSAASSRCLLLLLPVPAVDIRHPLPLFSMLVTLVQAPCGRVKRHRKRTAGAGVRTLRLFGRPGACQPVSLLCSD
jgi:hypothetical protein